MNTTIKWGFLLLFVVAIMTAGLSLPLLSGTTSAQELRIKGNESVKLDSPMGVVSDGKRIYVANAGQHQIAVFDQKGKFLTLLGRGGTGEGEFNYPVDVALNKNGDLYVADFHNGRIQVFSKNGEFRFAFPKNQRIKPAALAIDDKGQVYVTDVESHTIKIFTEKGDLVREFGEPGETAGKLRYANGIATSPDGGTIYVADSQNNRIQVFSNSGNHLKTIGLPKGAGLPKGLSYSGSTLYVADSLLHKIFVLDTDGNLIDQIGRGEGTFHFPNDVYVAQGKIYIADRGGNQVFVYSR
ncbi:6-bladed beta-propeller [Effusibacillus lacus]|uniref:6-bladed beta-propeller n=1 Tax=Effusibacillus lacus TaxID=1348429 RepID=A0A292YSC4_9BACL|nr:6-bladed beta-propeller [Effusibacillus lacus]TCS76119.1 NHL repeat-containing protein [Effusibacillus lacus]GAX91370.1 hypothetical protein EFBL_3039 [Effusibacillus lacus]